MPFAPDPFLSIDRAVAEKFKDHLLIQEYVLELAPAGILLHQDA